MDQIFGLLSSARVKFLQMQLMRIIKTFAFSVFISLVICSMVTIIGNILVNKELGFMSGLQNGIRQVYQDSDSTILNTLLLATVLFIILEIIHYIRIRFVTRPTNSE